MTHKSLYYISDSVLASYTFGCVKMSDFVPHNRQWREVLIFFFHSKETATEAYRAILKFCGDAAVSDTTCYDWFYLFKNCYFDFDDRPLEKRPRSLVEAE